MTVGQTPPKHLYNTPGGVMRLSADLACTWRGHGCTGAAERRTQLQALHPSSGTTWPSLLPKPTEVPAAGRAWS